MLTIEQQILQLRLLTEKIISILIASKIEDIDGQYKTILDEQIGNLQQILQNTDLKPYKVAIVGTFKVGKSSFVNALCDTKIASVNTNPETAAITIFRHSTLPTAQIYFTSKEEWNEMKELHSVEPTNVEALRYARIYKLETSGKLRDEQKKNLSELESKYLTTPSFIKKIECHDWEDKKLRKAFTDEIKNYTSSSSALHYLVDKLVVDIPMQLLQGNVELIDTPGLDDTDRYRVRMTEDCVKDVDAILFLTQSGSSYSQSNKDFLIKQLRRKTIKQLRIIVTKCDETYNNACRDAEENENDIPTYDEHIERERIRLREQLNTTLEEMLSQIDIHVDDGYYFIEQLDNVIIDFISSKYYKEKEIKKSGIEELRENLLKMLDESDRNTKYHQALYDELEKVCKRISMTSKARLEATGQDFNSVQLRSQLENISSLLKEKLELFQGVIEKQVKFLEKENTSDEELTKSQIESTLYLADITIGEYEKSDVMLHWRTRRSRGWGYINDLQNNVADRIFPKVELILKKYIIRFERLLQQIKNELYNLQKEFIALEESNRVETSTPLQITEIFENKYNPIINDLNNYVNSQRDNIICYLDEFVCDEIKSQIEIAREKVANIYGKGTTISQNREVQEFYHFLQSSLHQALKDHLSTQIQRFISGLQQKALLIYPDISIALDIKIRDRMDAIETSLVEITEQEKSHLINYLENLLKNITDVEENARKFKPNNRE